MHSAELVTQQNAITRLVRWRKLAPRQTLVLRFVVVAFVVSGVTSTAYAVGNSTAELIATSIISWTLSIFFACIDRYMRHQTPRIDRAEFTRIGRWMWAALRRSLMWLGFVTPRPESGKSAVYRIAVWVLFVPAVLGVGLYLFLKFGIAVGARWPVTDADEIAKNQERFDHTVRGGLCTALITAFFTAALPEEVLYRSVVLAAQRRKSGTWISVSVVAVLALAVFAWVHIGFGTGNVVSGLVVGALCTAIALYTRSLWPAILVHGVYDAIIMVSWALSV